MRVVAHTVTTCLPLPSDTEAATLVPGDEALAGFLTWGMVRWLTRFQLKIPAAAFVVVRISSPGWGSESVIGLRTRLVFVSRDGVWASKRSRSSWLVLAILKGWFDRYCRRGASRAQYRLRSGVPWLFAPAILHIAVLAALVFL